MEGLRASRLAGQIPDQLLFLEHPSVITIGRRESDEDLLLSKELLDIKGIKLLKTKRGGKITYHGPGQLVIYFVVDLEKKTLGVDRFVSRVEEGVKDFLEDEGIVASVRCGRPGLYVDSRKIASVGFHIYRGVSSHGAAVNISCDLTPFSYFHPCGERAGEVTSFFKETGSVRPLRDAARKIACVYARLFGWNLSVDESSHGIFSDEK